MLSSIPIFPAQASTFAADVDKLYFLVLGVTSFFAIAVVIFVAIFAIKYQDHSGTQVGAPIHGSIPLELAWSFIPFVISIGIFAYATVVYFEIVRPPAETLQIYSTGKRWMWRFQHINGRAEINELHVPKGRPVKITFTSEDVLHDIYIPAFRVKADAIPGRYSEIWFEPSQIGDFHLFCAEYCGTKHSGMIGRVVVMEPRDYQAWLSGSDGQPLAARGQQLFQQLACVTCHLNDGTGRGPSLAGVYGSKVELANGSGVVADEGYIRESILTPQMKLVSGFQPVMPTFQGLVNEEGVMSLIEYIKSLPAPAPAQTTTAPAARPAQR
ncbi:MAG TPA: cytochrome c oxidase subunit II [Vicinamibacterales bacterium]|jgi:cytochrome c oxidase subunit 2|nr:cytochrome c oxidase subunit II [Vicinamibacterales bacterium]